MLHFLLIVPLFVFSYVDYLFWHIPLLKQIYQSIKNKTEFRFVWPYMREDGTLGKSSRVISPNWIAESKLECKADAKGNLWMKTKLDDFF